MSDRPKIYVRPLASYVRGDLTGWWFDAARPAEELRADIVAKVTAHVPGADEWAIHESQGFGVDVDEYESLTKVSAYARALVMAEAGETTAGRDAVTAWLIRCDIDDEWCESPETLLGRFEDQYVGSWDSYADMAADEDIDPLNFRTLRMFVEQAPDGQRDALEAVIDNIRESVDWARVGVGLSVEYTGLRTDAGLFVFNTSA